MAVPSAVVPAWQRALVILSGTFVATLVVLCLYWAQIIFIPLALAIFFTFLLSPLVTAVQRVGIGRTPAVILVVLMAMLVLGGIGWIAGSQIVSLVEELPQYTDNIKGKIQGLREMASSSKSSRFEKMVKDIESEFQSPPGQPKTTDVPEPNLSASPAERSVVVVQPESPAWLSRLPSAMGTVAEPLGGFALTMVLVVFMLLRREDLRNRLIRLIGHGRVTLTTKAVDEAGQRISRFLFMQAVVNSSTGLAVTVGLLVIGVKYALLWGFLTAVLRYIPYVGAWISAIPAIALSLAMFDGWGPPLAVLALVLTIELTSNNVIEPWLYGHTMGVSEVALMVSAAFWAFLWGPIGMVLSSPLTVCLVVLGKYVPHLEFLDVLLGDEPPLEPDICFYQRLMAHDRDEASRLVLDHIKKTTPEQVYDDLLIPALNYSKRDRERDEVTEADATLIFEATREIVDELGERRTEARVAEPSTGSSESRVSPKALLFGCTAREGEDSLGLEMLQHLLDPDKWEIVTISSDTLTAELLAMVDERKPTLICIASLPPGGLSQARYLCKKLRTRFADLRIFVGRWGLTGNVEDNREQLHEAGANRMETTLLETRNALNAWLPVLAQDASATMPRDVESPPKLAG